MYHHHMNTESAIEAKVIELFDRATEALPESLRGVWSLSDDATDPMGDVMQHANAMNEIGAIVGATCDPTFSPSPYGPQTLADVEDWPDAQYAELVMADVVSVDDLSTGIKVLSTLSHGLRMLGVDY